MGTKILKFWTVFRQSGLNIRDCFWTIQAEFSGLFSDNSDKIFETVFGHSGLIFELCVCCFFYVLLKKIK